MPEGLRDTMLWTNHIVKRVAAQPNSCKLTGNGAC